MNEHIVIITGAAPIDHEVIGRVPDDAVIMAVDGGLDHALAAGFHPTHLVGDLDSVTDDGLAWAARHCSIQRHPVDKDQTDTELALSFAATFDPGRITLIGGGDRLDHTIAGIGALGALGVTSVPILEAWWDGHHVRVVQGPGSATLDVEPGSTLSLLALHGPCTKVVLTNTKWELHGVDLDALVGLGVSNEVADDAATVEVALSGGVLTIFDVPGPPATSDDPNASDDTSER